MNKIWIICLITSCSVLLVVNPNATLSCMTQACNSSFRLCFDLLIIYSIWLGLIQIADDSGLSNKLANGLSPVTTKLFGKLDNQTNKLICMNMATNILGMGGVSTPMGIQAMQRLQDGSEKATPNMKLLLVIACSSLQLLPTTVIGLRLTAGSANAVDIFLPTLITTTITTILGVSISLLLNKRQKL